MVLSSSTWPARSDSHETVNVKPFRGDVFPA
jgi:hypothetical protein